MTNSLSKSDVERLLADPSADTRALIAAKVAQQVGGASLSPEERAIAEDIVRALTRDAALRVRQALADQLKESHTVPRDVAVALAHDVDTVSLPILTHSLVLTDEDLVEIIRCSGGAKQVAIAARDHVSAAVADAIVAADEPAALATLVANDGAQLEEATLQQVLDRHGGNDLIKEPMARRAQLPVTVLERLVTAASAGIRDILSKRADLPGHLASDLVLNTRERATASLLSPTSPAAEALQLAQHLQRSGRLTPSLIIRAICLGDIAFVEATFAVLADIPVHNARLLIHDAGPLGFKAMYERCRLPGEFFELFRIGLLVAQQTGFDGGENDRERHRRRTLERILTQYDNIGAEDLDYLLGKLRAAAAAA
ncbi:MAG TPA: DUF2336 domain-containing protein [Stellaceae bacterium]|jgi:uncharacterized protein (DUF2336 family)|nr:DUF2336 domain-containing protein [Stellaceae bacterium]